MRYARLMRRRPLLEDTAVELRFVSQRLSLSRAPIIARRTEHHDTVTQSQPATPPPAYRLAAVTSHPVQYQAPLFRQVAAHDGVDLTVFYGHDGSLTGDLDRDFGQRIRWDQSLLDGYRSVFLQRRSERMNALGRLAADAQIITHLWRRRFDAVFIHSYATRLSLFAYVGALASRTPILLRTESERLRPRPLWAAALKQLTLRPLFALTAGFLIIGTANRAFFEAYGVKPSRQFYTPYSVNNTYFLHQRLLVQPSRPELRRSHGWTDDDVVVGFSGKLIERKGVGDLIDAVAALQAEGLRIGLLLIGDGPERSALEERVRARSVVRTVFTGFRNQSELAACYTCLDIFVLPSRFDPWGLVVNEAMLFGLPVLATDTVGASLDLIEHGQNGYVYNVGEVNKLAQHLRHLVCSADARRQFGKRSESIVQPYSYDVCVTGIRDALDHVSGSPRRRSSIAAYDRVEP